jgi:hypothetical protein
LLIAIILVAAVGQPEPLWGVPREVTSSQSAMSVEAYDFVEVTLNVSGPDAKNPFTEASVEGQFGKVGESARLSVDGFCDSSDGSVITPTPPPIGKGASLRACREPSKQ